MLHKVYLHFGYAQTSLPGHDRMFRSRIFGKTAVTKRDCKDCYRDNEANPQRMYGLVPTEINLIQVGGQEVGRQITQVTHP